MYSIIYFSPTGNARHLAKKLKHSLGKDLTELIAMEFCDSEKLRTNEHLILIFPVHAFNAPRNVKSFVKKLPEGLYKKVSLIAVGSSTIWMNDAVSLSLRKELNKKNYKIYLDTVLAMPLTIIMAFDEKLSQNIIEESENEIENIALQIKEGHVTERNVAFRSKLISELGKGENFAARLFGLELHANKDCISCSKCVNNCPAGNIKMGENNKPQFAFSCIMCMRCIYNCDQKAISPRFSKFVPISKGYRLEKLLSENKN